MVEILISCCKIQNWIISSFQFPSVHYKKNPWITYMLQWWQKYLWDHPPSPYLQGPRGTPKVLKSNENTLLKKVSCTLQSKTKLSTILLIKFFRQITIVSIKNATIWRIFLKNWKSFYLIRCHRHHVNVVLRLQIAKVRLEMIWGLVAPLSGARDLYVLKNPTR